MPATGKVRATFAFLMGWMSAGAPLFRTKMTLCSSFGKSNVTAPPTVIVVVKGVKEKPGIDTVAVSLSSPPASEGSLAHPPTSDRADNERPMSQCRRTHSMRGRILPLLGLALLAAARPGAASAQACLGLPAFSDASVHLNAAVEFPDSARSYAVGVGAGKAGGLFLNLGGGLVTYQGEDERARIGFAELGVQRSVGPVQLCPVAGGFFGAGPDISSAGIEVTSKGGSAGLALGRRVALPLVAAIPSAAVKWEYVSLTTSDPDLGTATETSSSGLLDLGVGLVYRDRFTVQPLAHIPFASDDERVSFGVFASVILPIPVPGGVFGR